MTKPELICFIVTEMLMTICVISHILIATVWKNKSVRLFFCIFSAIIVCLCAVAALAFKGIFFAFYEPLTDILSAIEEAPYLIAALAVAAACEFTGALYLLRKRRQNAEKATPLYIDEIINYTLPDNTRKKDERKHAEYKIIKENK